MKNVLFPHSKRMTGFHRCQPEILFWTETHLLCHFNNFTSALPQLMLHLWPHESGRKTNLTSCSWQSHHPKAVHGNAVQVTRPLLAYGLLPSAYSLPSKFTTSSQVLLDNSAANMLHFTGGKRRWTAEHSSASSLFGRLFGRRLIRPVLCSWGIIADPVINKCKWTAVNQRWIQVKWRCSVWTRPPTSLRLKQKWLFACLLFAACTQTLANPEKHFLQRVRNSYMFS